MRGKKNGIYRNLLESINDILPRIPLVTVMLRVCRDCEDVHLRSEMRREEMVKVLYFISFLTHTHTKSHTFLKGQIISCQGQTHRKRKLSLNVMPL